MYPRYYTENGDNIKFEFSEDESHWALAYDPELQWLKPKRRPIAGSKRVARYQMEQDQIHSGVRQVLQSITAHPDLSTRSFEELRVQCYAQSFIVQGKPPASVNATTTPEAVIPPFFNAYSDKTNILPNEIIMANANQ